MDQEYRHHQIFSNCPDKAAIHMAKLGLDSQSGDMGAILSSLNTWTSSYLAELINAKEPDITIEDIFEKNRLAYIAIPVGDAQFQTNALGRMLIALLLSYSQLRQKRVGNRNPAGIIFEEFAEFVTPAFATLVTTARSAGLRIVLSHQDLKQLRKIEGMDIEAFIGNVIANTAGFKIFFNAMDDEDAEKMARMFGTFTEFKTTRQLELMAFGIKRTKGYSERDVDSFHNHPNEIKRLIAFKAAVKLAGGEDPKLITTPLIFEVLRLN